MNLVNNIILLHRKKFKTKGYFFVLLIINFLLSPLFLYCIIGDLNYLPLGSNEASHLNVAKSVFQGTPPYIEHFDARGPILFYFLSLSFFFSNFLVGFHILYFFLTFLSGLICHKICEHLYSKKAATFAFLLSIFLLNQSQHPENLVFFCLAVFIYFTICKKNELNYFNTFYAGIFMSFAVLTRFNISVIALLGCLYFLTLNKNKLQHLLIYIFSGLFPLICILIIYHDYENGLQIFLNSTVIYHLNLTQGRPFYIGIYQFLELLSTLPWLTIFILSLVIIFFQKKYDLDSFFLFIFLITSVFATLLARKYNPHYLIVTAPFIVILASSVISKVYFRNNLIVVLFFLISLTPLLINNFYIKAWYFYKPPNFSYYLSTLIDSKLDKDDKIFSTFNGVNLYLDKRNYLKIVDVSHINRNYNYESVYGEKVNFLDVFKNILLLKPKFLIFEEFAKNLKIFDDIEKLISVDYEQYQYYDDINLLNLRGHYRKLLKSTSVYVLKN